MRIESPLVLAIGRLQRAGPVQEAARPEPLRGLRGTEDGVRVTLSSEAKQAAEADRPGSKVETSGLGVTRELSTEEQREVAELARRDREVRTHEAAHKGAAGGLANGGATFQYTTGPDGKRYAVGGEVSIDISPVAGDAAATERKMEQVQRAALAPASPSSQDRKVAASAAAQAQEARAEQLRESREAAAIGMDAASEPKTEAVDAARETQATGACSECGGQGHGPEAHRAPIDLVA